MDKRYQVEVQSAGDNVHNGTLVIFDHNDNDKLIYSTSVGVSYGALFGPDVADVAAWCDLAANVVDNLNGTNLRHS